MREASGLEIRRALKAMKKRKKRKAAWKKAAGYLGRFLMMAAVGFGAALASVLILESYRGRLIVEMAAVFFAVLAVGRVFFEKRTGGR